MNPTQQLHDLGQSLWLDNITRNLLASGIREYWQCCIAREGFSQSMRRTTVCVPSRILARGRGDCQGVGANH
jgi:hypothetical protein